MTDLLSPAQYMDLLKQRADEWQAQRPRIIGFPPLLEWFIRDDDHTLIDMDAIDADLARLDSQPKPERKPRTYRPASYWRDRLDRLDARMEALTGVGRHDTTDRAAHTGIGIRQTPRQRAKYGARIDRTAEQVVKLTGQRNHAARMLRKAEEREAEERPAEATKPVARRDLSTPNRYAGGASNEAAPAGNRGLTRGLSRSHNG